jgi:hypothetical protein
MHVKLIIIMISVDQSLTHPSLNFRDSLNLKYFLIISYGGHIGYIFEGGDHSMTIPFQIGLI